MQWSKVQTSTKPPHLSSVACFRTKMDDLLKPPETEDRMSYDLTANNNKRNQRIDGDTGLSITIHVLLLQLPPTVVRDD